MFILVIVAGLAIPRLRDVTGAELTSATRRLSNTVRYLYEEAAFRGTVYALVFDLDKQGWLVLRLDASTGEFVEDEEILSRPFVMPEGTQISDVVLPSTGRVDGGLAPSRFYPEGYADPSVIHLNDDRGHAYTVRIDPVRGRGEVFDGTRNFEPRAQ